MVDVLINLSGFDFVQKALELCDDFTDSGIQDSLYTVLEGVGQKPALSEQALKARKKLNSVGSPRNIITGKLITYFGLDFSSNYPADIRETWVRLV